MSHHVDGFAHPIPRDRLENYKQLVHAVANIWKEHGALDYWECVGDQLHMEGTLSFADMLDAKEDEAILFGWVLFDSNETREAVHKKVASDLRMEKLMAESDTRFDAARMAWGVFKPFEPSS